MMEVSSSGSESPFLMVSQLAPTFDTLQRLVTQVEHNSPTFCELIKRISSQYRSTMKLMIESGAGGSETRLLLEIWELLDIMLIDPRVERISSTELLTKLLKWSAANNDKINELELKAFQAADQFNCPEFWELVSANVLCGELVQAAELIQQHPDYSDQNQPLTAVHAMIASRPAFADFAVSGSHIDYEAAFGAWQNSVLDGFEDVDFEDYPGLERVAGIVVGDEATIDSCISLVGTWYRLLIAKCFFLCPTTDPRLVINSSNIPPQKDGDTRALMDLIDRIFEFDVPQMLRDMVALSDEWWFVAHSADLLFKLEPESEELGQLRDSFVSSYAESLLKKKDTWYTGLQYLTRLSAPDAERIENEIMEVELTSNKNAERIYALPNKLQLPNAAALRNRIAVKYASQLLAADSAESRGSALCWALRARDEAICARVAEAELAHFHQTEQWSIPGVIDALEEADSNSEQLTFLAKYKQFYGHVHTREVNQAAEDLISILACQVSSEILSIILKQALLLLDEDFTFTRNQIICIMRALQKQKESSRLRGVKLNPTEIEQGRMLSKSLAHHLSRSIIKR